MIRNAGTIAVKPYRLRMQTPYRWSKGIQHVRAGLILRADLDGAVGWGEVALPPHVDMPDAALVATAEALIAGLDPGDAGFLADLDLRECPSRLRCGFSMAVLTARARSAGVPLSQFLGREGQVIPDRVPVNDLIGDADPDVCVRRAGAALARGQDTVKMKCTVERDLDLARIGAVRETFPAIKIRIDPNESWPVDWAGEHLAAIARFDIDYVEEPLPRGTPLSEYVALRRSQPVPIALDDSARSLYHIERIAEVGAADLLILKAQRVGGPERLAQIVRFAEAAGMTCTITSSIETAAGLYMATHCAALTTPVVAAGNGTARFYAENIGPPPPIVDGHMVVPVEPGLGFDPVDWWTSGKTYREPPQEA